MAFEVVIAGGGFGGLYAARRLERRLPRHSARIRLVSDVNYLLYTPLLPGAASGTLEPRHVVVPLREELDWTEILLARVTGADPGIGELQIRTVDGRDQTLRYDQLLLALGSVSRVLPIPGLAEHGIGLKSLAEAIALRNRALWGRGIEIRTGTRVDEVNERSVALSTGERVPARTLCWTAGVRPPPVVQELGLPLDRTGRVRTEPTLRVKGRENVWAIGDAAAVPDPARRYREASPPTAQHAIRQGRVAANNLAATLAGGRLRRFRYRTLGVFVDMGQHKAVATMLGVRLRGFPAWFAARTYHLAMMPGMGRRLRLMADWTVGLLFGRATAELGQLGHPPSLGIYFEPGRSREEATDK